MLSAGLLAGVVIVWVVSYRLGWFSAEAVAEPEPEVPTMFGIPYEQYSLEKGEVTSGQTLSSLLGCYGIGAAGVDAIARTTEPVFPLRNIRAGHPYTVFLAADSTSRLEYFVYEIDRTHYLVISCGDSLHVSTFEKEVAKERKMRSATISTSLWNSMIDAGMTPAMAMDLSDIYAWSIDFFGLQKDDHFTVIYDELSVDSVSIGIGRIWGAVFNHAGKDYYAIPFKQNDKVSYWDENGNSLRKNFLKAPLKFSRISSRFSNSRLHPVLKIRRPHHGVDYAAPSGTPVHAVADGVVEYKGWGGGGGNTLKIKHSQNFMSGYLHLKGYAKGIARGKRVSQGELIGYVGSTGLSTGAHLDFRLWQGGKAIDPLKVPTTPAEPIAKTNRHDFEVVRDRMLAELKGMLPDSLKIKQLDSLRFN